ncbi:cobalamin-binding protein [Chitinibacter sp. S2-10]|uniref:cobalamin-binding protein n=1 Tax=Chitinibacter sp. S2-10 TaxID=3373597 RepID=UPI003977D300
MHKQISIFLCLLTLSCASHASITVKDDAGATITLAQPARRIISLAPHITEDLFAIGAGKAIVGTMAFSDYPSAAQQIERIGSYNGLDLERIRTLKPDLIIGWVGGNPQRMLDQARSLGIPLFLSKARKLRDVPSTIEHFGQLTANQAAASAVAQRYRQQLVSLEHSYARRTPVRVFYQIWEKPLMTINDEQIIADVLRVCGGVNVFGALPDLTPSVDVEAVLAANPDVIMTSGEPGIKADWLAPWQRWPNLKAVQNKQLYILPKDSVSVMGPRLVDGAKIVCETLARARR